MSPLRRPIEDATFTEATTRVAYQLVVLSFRRDPDAWRVHPPTSVYALAERLRADGFHTLYWILNGCARWLAAGYTLAEWRREAPRQHSLRAFHKRHAPRRG